MIDEKSFTKEWLLSLRKKEGFEKAHPELMEKMNYSLYLVEQLVKHKLAFTFKGGTCLILLLPKLRRFSIDVDIIIDSNQRDFENTIERIINKSIFIRYERDTTRKEIKNFSKRHYDLYYTSRYDGSENSILLDVVFDKEQHTQFLEVPIISKTLSVNGENYNVKVPTIDAISGDKLTAFAPNTIGIQYEIGKSQQIIKQMYDVSRLIDHINSFEVINESFNKVAVAQMKYFGKEFELESILLDSINTAYILALQERNRNEARDKYAELKEGIIRFKAYLPKPKYSTYDAIEDAAKAALLAAKLLTKNYSKFPSIDKAKYNPKNYQLVGKTYSAVYKSIKGMPNLSLFYWYHITKLLK